MLLRACARIWGKGIVSGFNGLYPCLGGSGKVNPPGRGPPPPGPPPGRPPPKPPPPPPPPRRAQGGWIVLIFLSCLTVSTAPICLETSLAWSLVIVGLLRQGRIIFRILVACGLVSRVAGSLSVSRTCITIMPRLERFLLASRHFCHSLIRAIICGGICPPPKFPCACARGALTAHTLATSSVASPNHTACIRFMSLLLRGRRPLGLPAPQW